MDKIFEHNIIKQESLLCRVPFEVLRTVSKFLTPNDLVHLSHTCKFIHRILPFYLIKSGEFWFEFWNEVNFSRKWFEGSAINFSINEINISLDFFTGGKFTVWMQIIRSGIVFLETQKFWSQEASPVFRFTKKNSALREYKPGDRLRFMVGLACDPVAVYKVNCFGYEVSLQLEDYEYGKPISHVQRIGFPEKVFTKKKLSSLDVKVVNEDANETPDICPIKGLTKEKCILNGFGWMNYKRKKDELSLIAEVLFEYKFRQEVLDIYVRADIKKKLELAQWEERCRNLLCTFFSRDGTSSGIILFPDTEITLCRQICQTEIWPRVLRTLNDWCKISSPENATGLIIRNYDLEDHFRFRGITEDEIKYTLGFNNSKNMFSFQENDKRFVAFNPAQKVILIIRLVELQKGELQLVKKEIDHCIDEVNLLCFLLKDTLAGTGVIVTGLVAYSGENAHSQSACKYCNNTIFSVEIFNSVETFNWFWETVFSKIESKDFSMRVTRNARKDKVNVFEAVASKILGYLSHLQFAMLEEPILPVPKQDATDNIKQAELLLDRYQMEIAYSDDKRIWLEGNYGTGKTVVALKKLELLCKNLKDKEVIYYVNFARKSPLDQIIKQRFEKYENVRAIKCEFRLSKTIKHQILRKERELGTKTINLLVDEYSPQDLCTEEVETLIRVFNEEEKFINSTILIAAQPIKINRVDNFYENGIKRQFFKTKHNLDKLIMATGIKVRMLNNVMRTTVAINNLLEITQKYLHNQSNRCVRQQQHFDIRSNLKEVTNLNLNQEKLKEMDFNSSFQNLSLESNFSCYHTNHASRAPTFQLEKLIDYDEIYKLVHTENIAVEENYEETVTSYRYTCHSRIGHGINGKRTQLIKLAKSADHSERIALMAAVFCEIIAERKSNRIAVIHFEPEDPPLWLKSLFELERISQTLTVTIKVEEFLKDTSKNLVLVKNLKFLRGLEFSKVLLILESSEHHLRHFIPEAIARCKSNLTILIRPSIHGNHPSDTVADLAYEWEKNLDNGILSVLKIGFCSKPSCNNKKLQQKAYCKDKLLYRFHKNSKLYTDFLKEIQIKNIRDVQPEYKEKKREAEAVLFAEFQDKKSKARSDYCDTQSGIEEQHSLLDGDLKNIHLIKHEKIGQGGFGKVYLCITQDTGVELAMKQVDTSFQNERVKKKLEALCQEILILSKLRHKRIVRYYGMLQEKDSFSILMEYAKGGTIHDLIVNQGAVQEKKVSRFCQQILKGLIYLHENKIVHRDLKCSNIILYNYHNCKLTDFGISKHTDDIRLLSRCGTYYGSIYWMSPEIIQREKYGKKSDIWSFGCTVLEMLNAKPPFSEFRGLEAAQKIVYEDLVPSYPYSTSAHCMEFVAKCLQKEPQFRPRAKELLDCKFILVKNE